MTTPGLTWLNSAGEGAETALLACCDVPRWATAVLDGSPYADVAELLDAGDRASRTLTASEVDRALAAHPRIGDRVAGSDASATFSRREQAAASTDDAGDAALHEANRAYEEHFGRVFLICASGLSAADVVAAARSRLDNDEETERAVVADELRRISRLRLQSLADSVPSTTVPSTTESSATVSSTTGEVPS
jgi:2-oxo-4-hydroxy-4-carboxy-5-ureidoimidazoline decarboxylase